MPRMLVEPRRMKDGHLTGCTGVTMEDGSVYRADKRGRINVENVNHAYWMARSPSGMVIEEKFSGSRLPGAVCESCGFSAFAWQCAHPCPRCGGQITKEES